MFTWIGTDILLANYLGSENYRKDEVSFKDLQDLCRYLQKNFNGELFFDLDFKNITELSSRFPDLYKVDYDNYTVAPSKFRPNRRTFNGLYPLQIAEKIEHLTDTFLLTSYNTPDDTPVNAAYMLAK